MVLIIFVVSQKFLQVLFSYRHGRKMKIKKDKITPFLFFVGKVHDFLSVCIHTLYMGKFLKVSARWNEISKKSENAHFIFSSAGGLGSHWEFPRNKKI